MSLGDSDVLEIKKDNRKPPEWWRSRSTIICIVCLFTILAIDYICKRAGFFDAVIATISINIVKDVLVSVFGHQSRSEESNSITTHPSS
jgi:hypothetical protein